MTNQEVKVVVASDKISFTIENAFIQSYHREFLSPAWPIPGSVGLLSNSNRITTGQRHLHCQCRLCPVVSSSIDRRRP